MPVDNTIIQTALNQFKLRASGLHGIEHWKRVEKFGLYLADSSKADTAVISSFAYLHDAKREHDGDDADHGKRAADFVQELYDQKLLKLTPAQVKTLQFACYHHNERRMFEITDVTIQTCWDSDRLDFWRLGVSPNPNFLYTPKAKEKATIEYAKKINDAARKEHDKLIRFEVLFNDIFKNKTKKIPAVKYDLPDPKEDFLKFLIERKDVLLHGSSQDVNILEPVRARDTVKQSGNKNAVYAVADPVLPIFYAIQNRKTLKGFIGSSRFENSRTGEITYQFRLPKGTKATQAWTNGWIYIILNKNQFQHEKDDQGAFISEWTCPVPVTPIARLEVSYKDFKYTNSIEYL